MNNYKKYYVTKIINKLTSIILVIFIVLSVSFSVNKVLTLIPGISLLVAKELYYEKSKAKILRKL